MEITNQEVGSVAAVDMATDTSEKLTRRAFFRKAADTTIAAAKDAAAIGGAAAAVVSSYSNGHAVGKDEAIEENRDKLSPQAIARLTENSPDSTMHKIADSGAGVAIGGVMAAPRIFGAVYRDMPNETTRRGFVAKAAAVGASLGLLKYKGQSAGEYLVQKELKNSAAPVSAPSNNADISWQARTADIVASNAYNHR